MCRSIAEGGRRCADGRAATTAPPPAVHHTDPPAATLATVTWQEADRERRAAEHDINGSSWNTVRSAALVGALARQAQHADNGGDPSNFGDQVETSRRMLHAVLTGEGCTPEAAEQKIARLVTAYATWRATPETPAKPARRRRSPAGGAGGR